MNKGKLTTRQDVEDFVRGCTLLGTGGGGSPEKGHKFLTGTLERAGQITWVDPSEVPDEAWTVCPFYMGSIAPKDSNLSERLQEMGMQVRVQKELVQALRELTAYSGISPQFVIAAEMGGINTPAPVDAAYELGLTVVDGDFSGRAIPEITQSLAAVQGLSVYPIVFCDYAGSVTIVKKAPSYKMVERIGKLVSAASFGLVGSAGFMMKGRDLKQTLQPGTLTGALEIGLTIRRSREIGDDPVAVTARFLAGWVLFKGRVMEKHWEDRDGYMFGHYQVEGLDEFSGHIFKVWFKNENHMTWLDGRPYVMSPDIIASVKLTDGEPITNTDISVGEILAIIGAPIHPVYRTEKGLAVMGPKHFGFSYDYVPIEELFQTK